ncbi:MAG TPA: prepilin-type N-terminal cleavage/methylation domain-containing protein [Burkholderiaceae bacterium]|nr:prepilin-type N-terminal cleavage/methylation domain-containing protein [Burkholderiaceae bacterium]
MMTRRDAQRGFTLIEMLVALVLMALVSLISWRGLEAVQHTGERLDDRAEETLSLLRVLGQIERDILLHAGEGVLPGIAFAAASGPAQANTLMPPGIAWSADAGLGLVRDAGGGRWQQVRWQVQDGRLFRAVGAPSHLLPLPAAENGLVVLERVRALTVNVWVANQGWVGPEQKVAANHGNAAGLIGLEIALYREGLAADQPYRKVVLLP